MRSKRVFVIVILTIVISCGILFFTKSYEQSYNKRIREEKNTINNIIKEYDKFKTNDETLINFRSDLYESLTDFFAYYETIEKDYSNMVKKYDEYDKLVKNVDNNSNYLLEKCDGTDYMSSDVTTKCFSFKRGYEKAINSFIRDVELFNIKIDEYNTWIKTDSSKIALEKYASKEYVKYVDIDKDGEYLGKVTD